MTSIGVAYPGDPLDPLTWSGSPAGMGRGLTDLGVEVRGIRAEAPPRLDRIVSGTLALRRLPAAWDGGLRTSLSRANTAAWATPTMAVIRSTAGRRSLRRAGTLDAIVQIGTGFSLRPEAPLATFEDITIVLALRFPYPGWGELTRREIGRRIDRQRRVYEEATVCLTSTRWAAASVVADYGIPQEKVHAVGVGRNYDPEAPARAWWPPRYLFVGKDWGGKNGAGLLRAFGRLRERLPEARLDVVGGHPPLDLPGVIGHGVLRTSVPEEREKVERLFAEATCFVLPSHFEASPIVFTEAAAAGLPSIGTAVGGSPEMIGSGGRVVEASDDDALAEAMADLADPATAERLGGLARERAALYTWRAVAERTMRALALEGYDVTGHADFL